MVCIKVLTLLILLSLSLTQSPAQTDKLSIENVSGSTITPQTPAFSSLRGGKMIYLKVIGHSLIPTQNTILVGNIPCKIPSDGVSTTTIACVTGDSLSNIDIFNQYITLISNGVTVTSTGNKYVNYVRYPWTPQLNSIFPSAAYGGQNVNFYGVHYITDLGDNLRSMGNVTNLLLGNDVCSRFDVVQPPIIGFSNENIPCVASRIQEAGKYNVTEQVWPGYAQKSFNFRRGSLDTRQYFEFTAVPTIFSVSPPFGNLGGQNISIKGSGFSPNITNNTVSINGTNCRVTASNNDQIRCSLQARNNSLNSKISSTVVTQKNPYFGGTGVQYARYNLSSNINNITKFISASRTANISALGAPLELGFRADMREGDVYPNTSAYAQSWQGYFTAPVTGNYVFRGTADDLFTCYLAQSYGSADPATTPLISSSISQSYGNFYLTHVPTAEALSVPLVANRSYFLECYHINTGGSGFFSLQVNVPNTDSSNPLQAYQVDYLTTNSTIQPEVIIYSMVGGSNGTIQLQLNGTSVNVTYGCNDSAFANALNSFASFNQYGISVVRNIYDNNSKIISTTIGASKIDYVVSIRLLRPPSTLNERFSVRTFNYTGTFLQNPTTPHSPLISGTFGLTIGGVTIKFRNSANIPFNIAASDLQTAIRTSAALFLSMVEVNRIGECGYSCTWIIQFKGYNSAVKVVGNSAFLSGGTSAPTITTFVRRNFSSNVVFDPVDYRFLNTASKNASVLVSVNSIPAICAGNCSYSFQNLTQIRTFNISGKDLNLSLTNAAAAGFKLADVRISVGGFPCTIKQNISNVSSYINCSLALNIDNSSLLVAGKVIPLVEIANVGVAGLSSTAKPFNVSFKPISLKRYVSIQLSAQNSDTHIVEQNLLTGGNNGGIIFSIAGTGFPLTIDQIIITICNSRATIVSINNIQVDFVLPACSAIGNKTINVTINSVSDTSLNFTYVNGSSTAPLISSLSPNSSNPGVKGTLEIWGQRFGNNSAAINVYLANATGKAYTLKVLQSNDTYIRAGLSGGLFGNFTVIVNVPSIGNSINTTAVSNLFNYSFTVSSVTPNNGSYFGGTLITIKGTNFVSDPQQTLVFVGAALNSLCNIQSMNSTVITCRTPPISPSYSQSTPLSVVASTRLIILNTCSGNCTFTYFPANVSPNITRINVTSIGVGYVSVNGTLFNDSKNTTSVTLTNLATNAVILLNATSFNATNVTFLVTRAIPSGRYVVKIRNLLGQSNPMALNITWTPGNQSWISVGGSLLGNIVSFTNGSNYPAQIDGSLFSITVSIGKIFYPLNIVNFCGSTGISIQLPPIANTSLFTLIFKGPINTANYTYRTWANYTPNADVTVTAVLGTPGRYNVSIISTSAFNATIIGIKLVSNLNKSNTIPINSGSWTTTGTGLNATTTFTASLYADSYKVVILTTPFGYVNVSSSINISTTIPYASAQQMSFYGGYYTITSPYLSPVSYITVAGLRGNLVSYNTSTATYNVPPLVTAQTQMTFNLAQVGLLSNSQFTYFSDMSDSNSSNSGNVSASFDGLVNTFYGSLNPTCYIGMDAGQGMRASVSRIHFFPNINWQNVASKILYSTFQGSNDQLNWTTLATVDQTVRSGWNVLANKDTQPNVLTSEDSKPYRYIRFLHNSTSGCNLAQIQLYGILISSLNNDLNSTVLNVTYKDGFNTIELQQALEFKSNSTATVDSVSPRYGDIFGGYTLTINGANLDDSTPVVMIDGIVCTLLNVIATQINCTVGARPKTPTIANNFTVMIGTNNAILRDTFNYVLKWSDSRTWGVDSVPVDGDLVYVPTGMTLLVDTNTPILNGIAVEGGTLIFSDDVDLIVQTGFIIMNKGTFLAGTETQPRIRQLTFIMYGNFNGKQLPMFGNKGIGCLNCKFSMFGTPRSYTWTTISSPILPGSTTFNVTDDIDWKVGEQIVVASTSFDHNQAERRRITTVSEKTITVDTPFQYSHFAQVQSYGTNDTLDMRAQVGLLTRNIKMMGASDSAVTKYGSHLMLTGTYQGGFEGQVGYTQFTQCGQPQILGRYCIHFHMAGYIPTSLAKGNAVYEAHARVITLHGVHNLLVEYNVGYRVKGHNYFVEDGIETNNIIRHNLAISSLTVTNMLQSDITVASYWVTNPSNDFYGNVAAGSDFYGIWYQLKERPDGPSAAIDICPKGNPLGYVTKNTAHSNARFGLRILTLASRLYPCKSPTNSSDLDDPWSFNPSIQSVFSNFTLYKNLEDGVLAEQVGNVVFTNFVIAESIRSGVEFYVADVAKEAPLFTNSTIIGVSNSNAASNLSIYNNMSAVITGRYGMYNITNVNIYNFPNNTLLLQTCPYCDIASLYVNLGTEVFVSALTLTNVTGKMLRMVGGMKRDVIYDTDASLSASFDNKSRTSGTIVQGFNHISQYAKTNCVAPSNNALWDGSIMCDQNVTVRRVGFTNLVNDVMFKNQGMKVAPLLNVSQPIDPRINSSLYTTAYTYLGKTFMDPRTYKPKTWVLPFLTGTTYNIWWGTGIDFSHMSIFASPLFTPTDKGIVFNFNYTQSRETFRVGPLRGQSKLSGFNYVLKNDTVLDPNVCTSGQNYFNNSVGPLRKMQICINAWYQSPYDYQQIYGIACQANCSTPNSSNTTKEDTIRRWSSNSTWPNGLVPQAGDNVTIDKSWTVLLDVDPAPLNYLIVDGNLFADDTRDVNLTANSIHLRAGNITAGNPTTNFYHNFVIQINGNRTDNGFYIDPIVAGNKYFVITGSLNLNGIAPTTVSTVLTKTAFKGDRVINVDASFDWKTGDTLVLSPSFSNSTEYQTVTIAGILPDGSIVLNNSLQYTHYGAPNVTIDNQYGTLDTRTRVGHVSRNIKIVAGPDANWGFTTIVYGYVDGTTLRSGNVFLDGVQFLNGGQLDTRNSALKFLNTWNGNLTSSVTTSSFLNCQASCILIEYGQNINIDRNVFYKVSTLGIEANNVRNTTITNNLVIGVSTRPSLPQGAQFVAGIALYQYVNPLIENIIVNNNYVIGSTQHAFAFSHIRCNQTDVNPTANNTAGSSKIGFILKTNTQLCQAFSYAKAFACQIGEICAPPSVQTILFSNFVMADNKRSITLKSGGVEGTTNHSAYVYNSYFTALSRPNCSECYGPTATDCNGSQGVRMFTPTTNGQIIPTRYGPNYDVICKTPLYDGKSFFYNVVFDNFRQNYSLQNSSAGVNASCGNNFVFKPHSMAWDFSGSVNLYSSNCTNCDSDSYLSVSPPNQNFTGWFGGCGDMVCTGLLNFLITDWNGSFFGTPSTIIPNQNNTVAVGQNCSFSGPMNSYMCANRLDFSVLEYQNIAADFNTRIMWPVNLTANDSKYTTVTNAWREWGWLGNQPLNTRIGRFVSIVSGSKSYNMSFASNPPAKLQVQIQKKSPQGNNSNYVIVSIYYPLPYMIRVVYKNAFVDPILLTNYNNTTPGFTRSLNTSQCGSNMYNYVNNTISFVVTEGYDCVFSVEVADTIQLSTQVAMSITAFFSSNSTITNFINNLCAFLNIKDTSTVKIVGVYSNTTTATSVVVVITPSTSNTGPSISQIAQTLNTHIENGVYALRMSQIEGFGEVLTSQFVTYYADDYVNSSSEEESNGGLIAGIIIAVLVTLAGACVVYALYKKRQAKLLYVNEDQQRSAKVLRAPESLDGDHPMQENKEISSIKTGL